MPNVLKRVTFVKSMTRVRLLHAALAYNLVVFLVFFAIYLRLDFAKHFESKEPVTWQGKLYFTMMMHASVGSNDITPKTDTARVVTGLHVMFAWLQLLLVFWG